METTTISPVRCPDCFGMMMDSTENRILGQLDRRCSCPPKPRPVQIKLPKLNRQQRRRAAHLARQPKGKPRH